MTTQHIETVIVGAGQAGLSVGHHLKKHDRPFIIVDGNDRIGDNWREQWDTLRLFTPAKYNGLPGMCPLWRTTRAGATNESSALAFGLDVWQALNRERCSPKSEGPS